MERCKKYFNSRKKHKCHTSTTLPKEANSVQRDWIVFPLIIALFDLVLMINGNHKAREICFKLQSPQGRWELNQFRFHCWKKIKCKWNQVKPLRVDETYKQVRHNPPIDNQPRFLFNNEFVTDRDSLVGLIKANNSSDEGFIPIPNSIPIVVYLETHDPIIK